MVDLLANQVLVFGQLADFPANARELVLIALITKPLGLK
jgi:hypothetical protein